MKVCAACQQEKPLEDFGKDSKRLDKLNIYCKICNNKRTREFYSIASNKCEKVRKQSLYRKSNKEKLNEQHRKYRAKNPHKIKAIVLGIYWPHLTPNDRLLEYNKLLNDQHGLCAICGNPEVKIDKKTGLVNPLSVDHNHKTGKVRGLLCNRCNVTIGQVMENTETLSKMISYLLRE